MEKTEKGNYAKLLESLRLQAKTIEADGLTLEVRNCFDREEGRLDPRTSESVAYTREEFLRHRDRIDPQLVANIIHLFGPENEQDYTPLEYLRHTFGWISKDLSRDISSELISVLGKNGDIPVWRYQLTGDQASNRPLVVFFHGGGFFGGSIEAVENQCKYLAGLIGGVVLSVDYPLAPEHRYPQGFNACYDVVKWAWKNAGELSIDPNRIGVAGDSAGGNLALVCSMRDRDEGRGIISYQALIYPTVSQAEEGSPYYFFREEAYENPGGDPNIASQIISIKGSLPMLRELYLGPGDDPMYRYISPITASLEGLPKTLVMTAEYDYLRMECEEFSRRLNRAGVENRHIRYGGIFHGTFDRLGYSPQVEDMLLEMAADINDLAN